MIDLSAQLKEKENWEFLLQIAIDERDPKQAVKFLQLWSNAPRRYFVSDSYQSFQLQIAEISEPDDAIVIYEKFVHELIGRKHRTYYQEAVMHLRSIQKVWHLSKNPRDWKQYIQAIRTKYPTLKALHSELNELLS